MLQLFMSINNPTCGTGSHANHNKTNNFPFLCAQSCIPMFMYFTLTLTNSGSAGMSNKHTFTLQMLMRNNHVPVNNCKCRYAEVLTAEEATRITRDKLIRLQSLYIEQFKWLQHVLKEGRRKYLKRKAEEKESRSVVDGEMAGEFYWTNIGIDLFLRVH